MMLVLSGQRPRIDWHGQRGLSFLQLGLRELARLCYQRLPLPKLIGLTRYNPPPASASLRKQDEWNYRIEFSRVVFILNLRLLRVFCTTKRITTYLTIKEWRKY
ncbi:MAG: hypothetical protein F6K63_35570 [Moorea sp. SIO1G6]|uniref:hypothetical protein n=1 Tax=Moorena sp. SIO1G6 TaxID=2607840 RepID=UPI0013BFC153|nr:hypothetical protein [Moorena sp. SIO1G6]NEQ15844.1 hypothetical protein [Moorena sp. SIO3E2]NET69414.1 hypothetical protein [Moorena sp. SIO1G6]